MADGSDGRGNDPNDATGNAVDPPHTLASAGKKLIVFSSFKDVS
jgi:hypothetical protein